MLEKLWRGALAGLAIAGVFALYLVAEAIYVEIDLAHPALVPATARNAIFSAITLILLSGVLPSTVLKQFRVRSVWSYLIAGAVSGVLTIYACLFVFAQTFKLFGGTRTAPPFGELVFDAFSQLPGLVTETPGEQLWAVVGAGLAGLVCGGLFWLALVWWPARKVRPTSPRAQ